MNIGQIGRPHKPATPKLGEIDAALHLLNAVGGANRDTRQYLDDLRAATEHNERLLATTDEKLRELSNLQARERQVIEREREVDGKLAALASDTAANMQLLAEIKQEREALSKRAAELADLEKREAAVNAKLDAIDKIHAEATR